MTSDEFGQAVARAIAPRPAVLLMDEPFSGLDVQLRDSMQEETLALLRETRTTSIIVTHDMKEYEAFFLDHLSKIPNVQSVNSSIVVTVIKESTVLPIARE